MGMSNAERQKKFRQRQKTRVAAAQGPDTAGLIQALANHHTAWGLPRPGDAAATVGRELMGLVQGALRSDLLLGYPYGQPDIDQALRGIVNYLLALLGIKLEDLPNPSPADIMALYPDKASRQSLTTATGRNWDRYARAETPAALSLGDRLALYWHHRLVTPVT